MPIVLSRSEPLEDFVQFSDKSSPFNLIDIVGDSHDKNFNPDNFLQTSRYFVYNTKILIDINKALSSQVQSVVFRVYENIPNPRDPIRTGTVYEIDLRDHSEQTLRSGTKKVIIDQRSQNFSTFENSERLSLRPEKIEDTRLFSFEKASSDAVYTQKSDPAQILSSGDFSNNTAKSIKNFCNSSSPEERDDPDFKKTLFTNSLSAAVSVKNIRNRERNFRNKENTLVTSVRKNQATSVFSESDSRGTSLVILDVIPSKKEISADIFIDKNFILQKSNFYIGVSIKYLESSKVNSQESFFEVDHEKQFFDFQAFSDPPQAFVVSNTPGKVLINLQKIDPTLQSVDVIKISYFSQNTSPSIENIGNVSFSSGNFQYFIDNKALNVSPNILTYRFVVKNFDGSYGKFSSLVVNPCYKTSGINLSSDYFPVFLRAVNKQDGIEILVSNESSNIQTIRLLRTDLGAPGNISNRTVTIKTSKEEEFIFVNGNSQMKEYFFDKTAIPNRKYKYFLACRTGSEKSAAFSQENIFDNISDTITRSISLEDQNIESSVDNPSVEIDSEGNPVANFIFRASNTKTSNDTIKTASEALGNQDRILDQLKNDTQRNKNIVAFYLERLDVSTGERSSYGIIPPGNFSDNFEIRKSKNIPEPTAGKKYEYIVKTCIRSPETFLNKGKIGFVARVDEMNSKITSVPALKFNWGKGKFGILPSQADLNGGISDELNWLSGAIEKEETFDVIFKISEASRITSFVVQERKHYNLLSWELSGDFLNIGYFLVWCTYNGKENLLGSCSAVGSKGKFNFKDEVFFDEVGEKSYHIEMISLRNFTLGNSKILTVANGSSSSAEYFSNCQTFSRTLDGKISLDKIESDPRTNSLTKNVDRQVVTKETLSKQMFDSRNDKGSLPFASPGTNFSPNRKSFSFNRSLVTGNKSIENQQISDENRKNIKISEVSPRG